MPRILIVEDRVPHNDLGRGYPRTNRILTDLVRLGYGVTLFPTRVPWERRSRAYRDIPPEVTLAFSYGARRLPAWLSRRLDCFDVVLVLRRHNLSAIRPALAALGSDRVVYDAESLAALRDIQRAELYGRPFPPQQAIEAVRAEVMKAGICSTIICVSSREASHYSVLTDRRVHVLGHAEEPRPTAPGFDDRAGFLFVGPCPNVWAPNFDALQWFIGEVLPGVRERLGETTRLVVAGEIDRRLRKIWSSPAVHFLGRTPDLTFAYGRARVFVAPVRYASGVPLKLSHAAAHGVPIVTTPLLAEQAAWQPERDLLVGADVKEQIEACVRLYTDEKLWRRLRANALERLAEDYSPDRFSARLEAILTGARERSRSGTPEP